MKSNLVAFQSKSTAASAGHVYSYRPVVLPNYAKRLHPPSLVEETNKARNQHITASPQHEMPLPSTSGIAPIMKQRLIRRHISAAEREIQLPPDGRLVLLGVNHLGDGILPAGLPDERDEEVSLVLEDAALEHLDQGRDGNAFLGQGGFDFVESRESGRSGGAGAGSRRGSIGSAVARRARLGLQGQLLGLAARGLGLAAGSVACVAQFGCVC